MRVEIRVPSFSESITEGTLLEWRVSPGQHVEAHAVLTSCEMGRPDARISALRAAMSFASIRPCVTGGTGSCQICGSAGTSLPR